MLAYINGEERQLPPHATIAQMAEILQLDARKVAVEVNLAIVPRSLYGETQLKEGDRVEVVSFIGGG